MSIEKEPTIVYESLTSFGLFQDAPCIIHCRVCGAICRKHYSAKFPKGNTMTYGSCKKPSHGITIKKNDQVV